MISSDGNVHIGSGSPTHKLDIEGNVFRLRSSRTIANSNDTGTQGEISWDAD